MPCDPNDVECQACARFEKRDEQCERCVQHSEWLSPDDTPQEEDGMDYRWVQKEEKEEDWDW